MAKHRRARQFWTKEDEAIVVDLYTKVHTRDIAKLLGRTTKAVNHKAYEHDLKKPLELCHLWKAGHEAVNAALLGTIRINSDGYNIMKVSVDGGTAWRLQQREVWKDHYGEYPPKGFHVSFKDRDRQNCKIDNLELLSTKEILIRNHLNNLPQDLQDVIQMKATITQIINNREKKCQKT